jgi:hypothetical protein
MAYGLTDEEQARLNAAPWPYRLEVARQLDAERQERDWQARQILLNARNEETLAYAAHTRRRADEETRKHFSGQPCDTMFCRATEHLL